MSEQETGTQQVEETMTDSSPEQPQPSWRVVAFIGLAIVVIALLWWNSQQSQTDAQTEPEATVISAADVTTPSAEPSPSPEPTSTELLILNSSEQLSASEEQTSTEVAPIDALPTVTPTPAVRVVTSRTVEISGDATLRVSLESTEFESSGAPLEFPLEAHTYLVTSEQPTVIDQHCLQLGLSHVLFDWDLELVPANNDLLARADIHLYDDFCDAPGERKDTVPIEVLVPADASAELTLDLQGQRGLPNAPGLLNSSTSVFLVLKIANRPAQ